MAYETDRRPKFRPNFRGEAKRGTAQPRKRDDFNYPDDWNQISMQARQRDGWRCQIHRITAGAECHVYLPPPWHGGLHVHHLTPVRKGGQSNPKDLITVCQFHHSTLHPHMQKRSQRKGRR